MQQETMKLQELEFVPYISATEIEEGVKTVAEQISVDFLSKTPVFLGVLNGSFMFIADLMRQYKGACEMEFIKMKSYQGIKSTGKVNELIGAENLAGKSVIVVEDIVDTGNTIDVLIQKLKEEKVVEIKIATLFLKPTVYKKPYKIDYVGFEIPNKFIVGYGMDYNGLGRNFPDVYQIKQ